MKQQLKLPLRKRHPQKHLLRKLKMDNPIDQIELAPSILTSLKEESPEEIFFRLKSLKPEKREVIYNSLDTVEFLLNYELNELLSKLFPHLPSNKVDRWLLAEIIANSDSVYQNNNQLILQNLANILGKTLS